MKAGRELDALVAGKVMGLTRHDESYVTESIGKVLRFVWRDGCGDCVYSGDMFLPRYSTNITDAWEVVEKFQDFDVLKTAHGYQVTAYGTDEHGDWQAQECADTPELAICLAALKAKGVTHE